LKKPYFKITYFICLVVEKICSICILPITGKIIGDEKFYSFSLIFSSFSLLSTVFSLGVVGLLQRTVTTDKELYQLIKINIVHRYKKFALYVIFICFLLFLALKSNLFLLLGLLIVAGINNLTKIQLVLEKKTKTYCVNTLTTLLIPCVLFIYFVGIVDSKTISTIFICLYCLGNITFNYLIHVDFNPSTKLIKCQKQKYHEILQFCWPLAVNSFLAYLLFIVPRIGLANSSNLEDSNNFTIFQTFFGIYSFLISYFIPLWSSDFFQYLKSSRYNSQPYNGFKNYIYLLSGNHIFYALCIILVFKYQNTELPPKFLSIVFIIILSQSVYFIRVILDLCNIYHLGTKKLLIMNLMGVPVTYALTRTFGAHMGIIGACLSVLINHISSLFILYFMCEFKTKNIFKSVIYRIGWCTYLITAFLSCVFIYFLEKHIDQLLKYIRLNVV